MKAKDEMLIAIQTDCVKDYARLPLQKIEREPENCADVRRDGKK